MNTQDDPRFTDLKFPCRGYMVEHWTGAPPNVRALSLLAYDLSGPECSIKTISFRRINDDGSLGQRTRCSVEMIFVSVEEATEEIRKEMETAVVLLKEELERQTIKTTNGLRDCEDWLRKNPRPNETRPTP